jgi:protein required for attachment to host cells
MKHWVVVANGARARVLEATDKGGYEHVADLVHPSSRQKGSELEFDRPGHVTSGAHGAGSAEYRPRVDPHERELEHFAQEVAGRLNAGVAEGRCAGLLLVASNPFLGHLKAKLSAQAGERVLRTVAHDYTSLSDAELAQRLAAG